MPIKFRCAYCNQLLAISRRKAGTVVRCPRCTRDVVVPQTSAEVKEPAPEEAPAGAAGPPLFEQSDFDDLFRPTGGPNPVGGDAFAFTEPAAPAPAPPVVAPPAEAPPDDPGTHIDAGFDVEPVAPPAPLEETPPAARGVLLSPRTATLLSVAAILALAVAFVAGLLVGYLIWRGG
jgi:phage FluMu protein Com